jgi:hypothetical protein
VTDRRIQAIAEALSSFDDERIDVTGLQSRLDAVATTLDSSYRDLLDKLRSADADLELVVFAVHAAQHREKAMEAVAELRAAVNARPSDH